MEHADLPNAAGAELLLVLAVHRVGVGVTGYKFLCVSYADMVNKPDWRMV